MPPVWLTHVATCPTVSGSGPTSAAGQGMKDRFSEAAGLWRMSIGRRTSIDPLGCSWLCSLVALPTQEAVAWQSRGEAKGNAVILEDINPTNLQAATAK